MADVGIGVETAAHYFGLDFIPLREERYDLIMRTDFLKTHSDGLKIFGCRGEPTLPPRD